MPIQGNLVPGWSWEAPVAGPPNADWSQWIETETPGLGAATVEAAVDYVRFGVYSLQLTITDNTDACNVTSAAYVQVNNDFHYILRFSHYKVSGANTMDVVIKQYNAGGVDQADDIVITPAGTAAWATSQTVIHPAGEGGNDWHANMTQVKIIVRVDTTVASWRVDGLSLALCEPGMLAAFGSQVFINGYEIGELTNISTGITGDTIDTSSHDSPNQFREFCSGMKDGGEITIEGNLDLSDAAQVAFETDTMAGANRIFYVIFPAGAAELCCSGIPTGFTVEAPYEDKLSFSGSIKVDGKPVFQEATF